MRESREITTKIGQILFPARCTICGCHCYRTVYVRAVFRGLIESKKICEPTLAADMRGLPPPSPQKKKEEENTRKPAL